MHNSKEIDRKIDELLLKEPTPENLNLIGDLFLKKGDKKRAIDYFMKAAKNTAMPKKAIALYKKILRITPLDTEVYESLIDMLERSYNIPEAIKYLDLLSRLYQNKGETLKFTETQRRIRTLKHDWERISSQREIGMQKKTPVSFEEPEMPKQDLAYVEEVAAEVREKHFPWRLAWFSAASLLIIIIFSAILLFSSKKEIPKVYQANRRIDKYEILISSITGISNEEFSDILRPEDLKVASFNLITIRALEGCIPNSMIDSPLDNISCLNDRGEAKKPIPHPVTEGSKSIIYKFGICSRGNDAVFAKFCIACPTSHSSAMRIDGLISEPLVISWEKR